MKQYLQLVVFIWNPKTNIYSETTINGVLLIYPLLISSENLYMYKM